MKYPGIYDHLLDREGPGFARGMPHKLYSTLCRLRPETRLVHGSDHRPHSGIWGRRYAKYRVAKTLDEAVSLGMQPQDLRHDVLRGIKLSSVSSTLSMMSMALLLATWPSCLSKTMCDMVSVFFLAMRPLVCL